MQKGNFTLRIRGVGLATERKWKDSQSGKPIDRTMDRKMDREAGQTNTRARNQSHIDGWMEQQSTCEFLCKLKHASDTCRQIK